MDAKTPKERVATLATRPPLPLPSETVKSDLLLRGRPQLAIVHNNDIYYLRQTRFGKLILTK